MESHGGSASLVWGLWGSLATPMLAKGFTLGRRGGGEEAQARSKLAHVCESAVPLDFPKLTALQADLQPSIS